MRAGEAVFLLSAPSRTRSPDFIAVATSDYLPPDLYLVGFSGADLLEAPIDEGGNRCSSKT